LNQVTLKLVLAESFSRNVTVNVAISNKVFYAFDLYTRFLHLSSTYFINGKILLSEWNDSNQLI